MVIHICLILFSLNNYTFPPGPHPPVPLFNKKKQFSQWQGTWWGCGQSYEFLAFSSAEVLACVASFVWMFQLETWKLNHLKPQSTMFGWGGAKKACKQLLRPRLKTQARAHEERLTAATHGSVVGGGLGLRVLHRLVDGEDDAGGFDCGAVGCVFLGLCGCRCCWHVCCVLLNHHRQCSKKQQEKKVEWNSCK